VLGDLHQHRVDHRHDRASTSHQARSTCRAAGLLSPEQFPGLPAPMAENRAKLLQVVQLAAPPVAATHAGEVRRLMRSIPAERPLNRQPFTRSLAKGGQRAGGNEHLEGVQRHWGQLARISAAFAAACDFQMGFSNGLSNASCSWSQGGGWQRSRC